MPEAFSQGDANPTNPSFSQLAGLIDRGTVVEEPFTDALSRFKSLLLDRRSMFSTATNKKFAESLGLDYPILSDPTKGAARAYGVLNAANGMAQRWTFYIGKDGKIVAVDQSVQTATHGKTVAEQARKLGL